MQAENYNKGGANVAYYDLNKGNEGGKLRKDDVDIYQPNMGIVVGYNQKGEWLKYTVNVAADGEYEISANVAGENGTGSLKLYMDDQPIGTEMANTGAGFETFEIVSGGKATLTKGEHIVRLVITGDNVNVDWFSLGEVSEVGLKPAVKFQANASRVYRVYSVSGKMLGTVDLAGKKAAEALQSAGFNKGVYMLKSIDGHKTFMTSVAR